LSLQFAQSLLADPHLPVTQGVVFNETTAPRTAQCLGLDSSVGGEW